jgi:conjugal transfer pilus assembly protein TraV
MALRRFMTILMLLAAGVLAVPGCGHPKYACGVPDGLGCTPLAAVYDRAASGALARTHAPAEGENVPSTRDAPPTLAATGAPLIESIQPGAPLLTRPRHVRVWVNRWEDGAGDLHDETYLYLRLDPGRWVFTDDPQPEAVDGAAHSP